jgi:membrane protein YdbS with pleckstrin-like domain
MARPDPLAERPHHGALGRYLLDGEQILTKVHHHWAKVAEPVATVVAALVLVLLLDSSLPATLGGVANLLWWAWFVLIGRALWKLLSWRHEWFVATDKRLILTYGLITQRVAMMPLAKVTDMSYNRTPLGRLLGYGTFVMESAGQDQALHRVEWVPSPDQTYRAICAEIFGVEDDDREHDDREHDEPGSHGSSTSPHGSENTDYSTAIRIRPAGSQPEDGGPDSRDADTGPIHYGPSNS